MNGAHTHWQMLTRIGTRIHIRCAWNVQQEQVPGNFDVALSESKEPIKQNLPSRLRCVVVNNVVTQMLFVTIQGQATEQLPRVQSGCTACALCSKAPHREQNTRRHMESYIQKTVIHILVSNSADTGVHADKDRPGCQVYKYHQTLMQIFHQLFIHECHSTFSMQQLAPHYPKAGANHELECTKPCLQHGYTACVVLASFLLSGPTEQVYGPERRI